MVLIGCRLTIWVDSVTVVFHSWVCHNFLEPEVKRTASVHRIDGALMIVCLYTGFLKTFCHLSLPIYFQICLSKHFFRKGEWKWTVKDVWDVGNSANPERVVCTETSEVICQGRCSDLFAAADLSPLWCLSVLLSSLPLPTPPGRADPDSLAWTKTTTTSRESGGIITGYIWHATAPGWLNERSEALDFWVTLLSLIWKCAPLVPLALPHSLSLLHTC